MSIAERVQERIESDLTPDELQLLIDEANQAILLEHGPHADDSNPITVRIPSADRHSVSLMRPIDTAHPIEVNEHGTSPFTTTPVELAANDYDITNGGRTLHRLAGGTNSSYRWGRYLTVTYTPVNDGNQREEVIIKLVQLAIEYKGLQSQSVGDESATFADYQAERDRLLASLRPRRWAL
jgi:hypothetical protein